MELSNNCNQLSKLGIATKDIYSANKHLRDLIHVKDDEVARLNEFEKQFRELKRTFEQYKKMDKKLILKSKGYQDRIQQELIKDERMLDSLNKEISNLNKMIKEQNIDNDRSERDLRENVERLAKLLYTSEDNVAPPFMPDQNSIMKRSYDKQAT